MSELYASLIRNVIAPIGDRYRGVPIGARLRLLRESQWWPAEKLRAFQDEKLRALIAECYAHVPLYREIMDERGLRPADISSVDDLVKLPLMDKKVMRDRFPDGLTNRSIPRSRLHMHRTGGSTGEPMFFYLCPEVRAYDRASYYRFLEWCGMERGDLLFSVWGARVVPDRAQVLHKLKHRLLSRQIILDAFDMNPATMEEFMVRMNRARPKVLRGYTSALVDLALFVQAEGLPVPALRALTTTAEQVLPEQRKILEDVFKAPLFDQYGCGEVGGIAYECSMHTGLHVASEHCIVEIVNDDGNPVSPGQTGRVALTNLDGKATPFIRYLNGDAASLLPKSCSCGRALPLMSPVTGRISDMLYGVNGNRAHGEFFTHLLNELGLTERLRVREFQVVQTDADRLEFKLASEQPASERDWGRIVERIKSYLGPMKVDYRQVERVERGANGKLRFTLRQWQPQASAKA